MLKAGKLPRKGLTADYLYEVADGDTAIATINETRSTFDLAGQSYAVLRKGAIGPEFQLTLGEAILATARQKPLFNHFTLVHGGTEWTFKAIGMLATKFGLYDGDKQNGTVASGPWLNRMKGITADLPADLPREIQVFLILLAIHIWSQPNT